MAKIINHSPVTVEFSVFDGVWKRAFLQPGRQTNSGIDVAAVQGVNGGLFNHDAWLALPNKKLDWNIATNPPSTMPALMDGCVVVLHDGGGIFRNANPHFTFPTADATEPYGHAVRHPYRFLDHEEEKEVKGEHTDPPHAITEQVSSSDWPINEYGTLDGEYERGDLPFGFTLFGDYIQTGPSITVRICMSRSLLQFGSKADQDPSKFEGRLTEWKEAIRALWNSGAVPKPVVAGESKSKFRIDVEWVSSDFEPHYRVWARAADKTSRTFMFLWDIDLDQFNPKKKVSAHEFGHYLGFTDSYIYKQEYAELSVPIEQSGFRVPEYGWWDRWFKDFGPSALTFYKDRVERRLAGGVCSMDPHLMEDEAEPIGQMLVDCLAERVEQPLCHDERLWKKKLPRRKP